MVNVTGAKFPFAIYQSEDKYIFSHELSIIRHTNKLICSGKNQAFFNSEVHLYANSVALHFWQIHAVSSLSKNCLCKCGIKLSNQNHNLFIFKEVKIHVALNNNMFYSKRSPSKDIKCVASRGPLKKTKFETWLHRY